MATRAPLVALMAIVLCAGGAGCAGKALPPAPARVEVEPFVIAGDEVPSAAPLVVGTYNIHWLRDAEGLRKDFQLLNQTTVWCLQEVRVGPTQSCAAVLGRVLPPGRWYGACVKVNPLRELPGEDWECQAIVSRFPLTATQVWELDASGRKRRVALVAQARDVRIINTDHQPDFLFGSKHNLIQARKLAECLSRDPAQATIAAGDFNCADHLAQVDEALGAVGFQDVAPQKVATFHAGLIHATIDRIFVRNVAIEECHVETRAAGSDHYPVTAGVVSP